MVGVIQPLASPDISIHNGVTTLVDQTEEPAHPLTELVDEAEAKEVILEMLGMGIPECVIRPIFDSGFYEILTPNYPGYTPYLAITYTNDPEEGYDYNINSPPAQDLNYLMVPKPGMTAEERGEWKRQEQLTLDHFQWGSLEYRQDSGQVDSIPCPVLYSTAEFEDLEAEAGLQIYFTGRQGDSLNLCASNVDGCIEPWRLSKSGSESGSSQDVWMRDWSGDYELGDVQNLAVGDDSSSMEQDSSVASTSCSEAEDLDMTLVEDTEGEGEEIEMVQDCS